MNPDARDVIALLVIMLLAGGVATLAFLMGVAIAAVCFAVGLG